MTTDNTTLITQLLEAIDNSRLSEDRKEYWFTVIASGRFNEAQAAQLNAEFDASMAILKAEISHKKAQIHKDKRALLESKAHLAESLQDLTERLPAYLEKDRKAYESKVLACEDKLMKDLEHTVTTDNKTEMNALYAKLGIKKN